MKQIVWDNPNKMRFDSPLVIFNRQTNVLGTGNMIANTQYSSHIRAYTETDCNGRSWEPGYLREADLKTFRKRGLSGNILNQVRNLTRKEGA